MTKNVLVQKLPFDNHKQVHGSDDIVLVVIDEKSVEKYRWPWKRELHCKVFEYFYKYAHPKIIVDDSVIATLDTDNPASDNKYFNCIKKFNNLIAGFTPSSLEWKDKNLGKQYENAFAQKFSIKPKIKSIPKYYMYRSIMRFPQPYFDSIMNVGSVLVISGPISGNIGFVPFGDEIYRNQEYVINYKNTFYPSIAMKVFLMLNNYPEMVITKNEIQFPTINFRIRIKQNLFQMMSPVRYYKLYDDAYSHTKYSALDVMDSYDALLCGQKPVLDAEIFKDKIVVIGANVPAGTGLNDNKNTPLRPNHPGVDYQATVIDNIIHNDFLYVIPEFCNVLITLLLMFLTYFSIKRYDLSKSVLMTSLIVFGYIIICTACFYHKIIINVLTPLVMLVFATIFAYTNKYVVENINKEKVKSAMGKYMSQDVMQSVVQNIDNLGLGGKRAVVTVLFADIRGFTAMSEKMSAQQVSEFLNEYFSEMEPIITSYNGIINKFIGDAIMAVFGEPIQDDNHAQNAVKCGYAMLQRVEKLHKKWAREGKPEIEIGVGINTGEVFIGNIGSVNRMEYTVIGDTVNLASRLESYNKMYKTKMLISTSTYKTVKNIADVIKIPEVQIRGKSNKIDIYEVLKVKLN